MEDVYLQHYIAHPVNLKSFKLARGLCHKSIFVGEIKFIHILYFRFKNLKNTLLDL